MRPFLVSSLVAACLTAFARADDSPDYYFNLVQHTGQPCQTTNDCTFKDAQRCTSEAGCQPLLGSFYAQCETDKDCHFGLICKQDEKVKPGDFKAHVDSGAKGKINVSKLLRCFFPTPPAGPRLNPSTKTFNDQGTRACSTNEDCPGKNCQYGVCIIPPGKDDARCVSTDWCQEGSECLQYKADLSERCQSGFGCLPHELPSSEGPQTSEDGLEGFCYTPAQLPDFQEVTCTANGLGCWRNKSCCSGYCAYGPFFGLPMQCENS